MEVYTMPQTQLTRSESDKMIAGVCGGLAAYLGIDVVFVRLAAVVLLIASGIGLPIYLILWVVMPTESRAVANGMPVTDSVYQDPSQLKNRINNPGGTLGIILVLFGLFFLLDQFGWIGGAFWPVVLIGTGLFVLIRRNR
jgi:phage shock protein PspC (stress-responsive transcriptional regulator)